MPDPDPRRLSARATGRLAQLSAGEPGGLAFTSDLTVGEFLLVKQAGFRPLGLVLGSSIYHLGIRAGQWSRTTEVKPLSEALYQARELAMTRMEAEADQLGADGIVAVRLTVGFRDFGPHIAEFTAIGTAVKADDTSVNWRNDKGRPFTSAFSGRDFWTLIQTGYAPLGMVMGTCVFSHNDVAYQPYDTFIDGMAEPGEISGLTQALYDACERAMSRLQAEARSLHAEGIVGVSIDHLRHMWTGGVMEFFAVGTAVRPLRPDHTIEKPRTILSLDAR